MRSVVFYALSAKHESIQTPFDVEEFYKEKARKVRLSMNKGTVYSIVGFKWLNKEIVYNMATRILSLNSHRMRTTELFKFLFSEKDFPDFENVLLSDRVDDDEYMNFLKQKYSNIKEGSYLHTAYLVSKRIKNMKFNFNEKIRSLFKC